MTKTRSLKKEEAASNRRWVVVDATDVPLGRLATEVATVLRGKHRPDFTPHVDCGDFVIVINAAKVRLTGQKLDKKIYWKHTGYVGGIKGTPARTIMERYPERIIEKAVKGMLPKNSLGSAILKKLKVYASAEHPHSAQKPEAYTLLHSKKAA